MPEPAASRPLAEPGSNGADSSDQRLGELRRLLIGPEQVQIAQIEKRLDDPDLRAEEISRVLPAAKVRRSLEQLIKAVLKRNPDLLAQAIRPVILMSVRKAVADALREFTDSMNLVAEKSVSLRALRWRFEAFRTGKRFSDVVLSRSLLYSVREVFLIHAKTGILLRQVAKEAVTKDPDMISSMFAAIQEFVRDSFIGTENQDLETIDVGSFKLWIQHGSHAMVAGAIGGTPPPKLKGVFREALDEVEQEYAVPLKSFQGDVTPFEATRPILERCLLGQSGPKPRRPVFLWLLAGMIVGVVVLWASAALLNHYRWNGYLRKLSAEPGIVLTRAEKQGSRYVVSGLRDEAAQHPASLLEGTGIPAARVEFRLEPYLSLDPAFVAARGLSAGKDAIEGFVIRFRSGQSRIAPEDMDPVDELAGHMRSLFEAASSLHKSVRIDVIGHADEMGPEDANARISQDRADQVASALAASGINRQVLTARGVATSQPVRTGSSDRDRSFNRSVSFRVAVDK